MFKGLEEFYKLKNEEGREVENDFIIKAKRTMTLDEAVEKIHTEQVSRYEVRDVNGIHVADVYIGDEHKGTFYLGSSRNLTATRSILTYVMFNAAYHDEPETIFTYKWKLNDAISVQAIGTLFSERVKQALGDTNFKPSYLRYPCILGLIAMYRGKPITRELKFTTVEELQNVAQALRCFSFSDIPSFLAYVGKKEDDGFVRFYEQSWVENSGASEMLTHARDYVHASILVDKGKEATNDSVGDNEERITD